MGTILPCSGNALGVIELRISPSRLSSPTRCIADLVSSHFNLCGDFQYLLPLVPLSQPLDMLGL